MATAQQKARVVRLRIAPVKSLACVERTSLRLERAGVAEDRRLFLVDDDDVVVTQRRHRWLGAVVPDLDLAAGTLSVAFPDGTTVSGTLEPTGVTVHTSLFGKNRVGPVVASAPAAALSERAGEPLRLVMGPAGVGWDEQPVSLLGNASAEAVLRDSARRHSSAEPLPAGHSSVRRGLTDDTLRFRMTVEVDGVSAFEEDTWVGQQVGIGSAVLEVVEPLGRCVVITHDPATGDHDWDGLKVLARLRGPRSIDLGVVARVVQPGDIRLGDHAELTTPS